MTDEVRQEDREAAALLYEDECVAGDYRATNTRLGNMDDLPTVQAFARHASPLRARIAELEGALERMLRWSDNVRGALSITAPQKAVEDARATLNGEKKHLDPVIEQIAADLAQGRTESQNHG